MVYPIVENLSDLGNYSKDIFTFSERYLTAANTSYRTYSVALAGQHGDAIQLFVDKLNTIQASLFDQYPEALAAYAKTVAVYQEGLTGLGFNKRMHSDIDGATTLSNMYSTGDQFTEIETVVTNLSNVLSSAASAAEVEAPNLSSIKASATANFALAGSNRVSLATAVNDAWESFTSDLTENAKTIEGFKELINHVIYFTQITPGDVAFRIQEGYLDAAHMHYLDGINNEHDLKAVKILLSESDGTYLTKSDFFIALGNIDYADKLSDGMVDSIYGRVAEEMNYLDENGYSENLGYFFQSMTTNLQREQASNYAQRLSNASVRSAAALKGEVLKKIPKFPPEGSSACKYEEYYNDMQKLSPMLIAFEDKIGKAGLLNDIFEYIQGNELGYDYEQETPIGGNSTFRHTLRFGTTFIKADSLYFNTEANNRQVTFDVAEGTVKKFSPKANYRREDRVEYENFRDPWKDRPEAIYSTDKIEITDKLTAIEVSSDKAAARIDELRKGQDKALEDLIKESSVSALKDVKGVSTIAGTTKALFDGDFSGALAKATDDVPLVGTATEIFDNIVKYSEKLEIANGEIKDANGTFVNNLFDAGGSSVAKNGQTVSAKNNVHFDLGAILMQNDTEQNGLRAYIYVDERRSGKTPDLATQSVNSYDAYMHGNDPTGVIPQISNENAKTMLTGGSSFEISDKGGDKNVRPQELYDALQELASQDTRFGYNDWYHTYSNYYDELTGHRTNYSGS